ncbi:MAG: LLM class flavin-dependent oxidoreductase [Dehalococcoidia bacterium]|nr:LLM class flavin-dependent oxidoreductase [Dehalococcoidia bacterium]
MVKVMLQIYPVMPAASEEERIARRPLGRSAEVYQETIDGVHDLVRAADEMGLWGCATIEHHFHSEGYEVGPQPGILNAYWAAITKNIRIGQLGYVMSAQNPIRVAEEVAILDHLLKGRSFVGFARGYQALDQHAGPAPGDPRHAVAGRTDGGTARGGGCRGLQEAAGRRRGEPSAVRGADRDHQEGLDAGQHRAQQRALADPLSVRHGHRVADVLDR